MESVGSLVKTLKGLTKPIQIVGFIVACVTVFLTRTYAPTNIPAYFFGIFAGSMLLVFGSLFAALDRFVERDRPAIVLTIATLYLSCFLLVGWGYVKLIYLANETVDVYLWYRDDNGSEHLVLKPYTLHYVHPGRGPEPGTSGKEGNVEIRGVPSHVTDLDVNSVQINGFDSTNGSFKIKDRQVRIYVKPSYLGPEPWSLEKDFPDPSVFVSARTVADKPPPVLPKNLTLTFSNETDVDLYLVLFVCSVNQNEDKLVGNEPAEVDPANWIKRPLPANSTGLQLKGKQLEKGNGWYVIYVATEEKRFCPIGVKNLFATENPSLIVQKQDNPERPYRGIFTGVADDP